VIAYHADDAVVAIFGLPGARGNDTECAALAAAAIHRSIASPLRAQIGIANGSVLRDQVGSTHYRQSAFIGSCVALAASLAQDASPGETLVADAAYHTIAGRFEARPAQQGGFSDGMNSRAWRLGGTRAPDSQPFVGRQRERDIFAAALDGCRTSGGGQTFLVRGEAGIGKSRLIEEFEAMAGTRGFATHKALVLDFGSGIGEDPIAVLAQRLLHLGSRSDSKHAEQAVEGAVTSGKLEPSQRGFLRDLLGLPLPAPLKTAYDAMDLTTREEGRRATLTRLIQAAAASEPLLLAIEDIHWAGAHLLAQLATVASAVGGCAALLVLSTRSEADPLDSSWRAATHGSALTTIDLAPLRDAEAAQLAQSLAGHDDAFVRRCVERAAGNPLFLEQLLRNKGVPGEQVPHSVQSIVRARIDRLNPQDRQAARAAAMLGQRFSLAALRHVLGDDQYLCAPLLAQQLIRPWGDQYLFTHALNAEAIYGSLPASLRKRLHTRAAEWFSERDATLVAEHLDRAQDVQAAQAYLRAARIQASEYHNDAALRLVRRGLLLHCSAATWHELVCLEAELLQEAGAIDDSIAAYWRAFERAETPVQRCRVWTGIAAGLRVQDRYEEALDLLDRAQSVATRPEELALIEFHRGNVMVPLGQPAACLQAHEAALRYARAASSALMEARALSGLGDAYYLLGRMGTAYQHFARCIAVCREKGFGRIEVANLAMQGATRFYAGEVESAIADTRGAADLAVAVGNRRAEAIARNVLGYLLYYAADHEAAQEQACQSLALAQALRSTRFEIKSLLNLGLAKIGLHRPQDAEGNLEEAYATAQRSGITLWTPWLLGAVALVARNAEKRGWALTQGEAMLANGSAGHSYLHFYQLAAEAALIHGDSRNAVRYAELLEAYSRAERSLWSDFWVARARALVQRTGHGASDTCEAQLQHLVQLARQTGLKQGLAMLDTFPDQSGAVAGTSATQLVLSKAQRG
jgi:predicted ATPase